MDTLRLSRPAPNGLESPLTMTSVEKLQALVCLLVASGHHHEALQLLADVERLMQGRARS